jgi:hypothetical protein
MLDSAGHDEHLSLSQLDVPVAEPDRQPPLQDEEEIVRVRMRVPDELAADLADLDLAVVEVADDVREEVLVEAAFSARLILSFTARRGYPRGR